ncbi:MAG: universal stress protein [Dehalococcoidia bacterium]|nr:universal stress protein [Dehalococcoidia bacterium]MDW8119352.1 universal stress protein [Chloroflexota bacterium]
MKTILVALDGSPIAEQVLPWARLLGERLPARLILFTAVPPLTPEVRQAYAHLRLPLEAAVHVARAEEYLSLTARPLREVGLEVFIKAQEGEPVSQILAYAQEVHADFIALTTHGRTGLTRLMLGSVADRLVRTASIPLLLVKARPPTARPTPPQVQSVLVPLDGSPLAETVLPLALDLATALQTEVILARVVSTPAVVSMWPEASSYVTETLEALRQEALAYLSTHQTRLQAQGHRVRVEVREGQPAEELVALARRHKSLVVMATHGYGGARRLLLGSVAQRVVLTLGGPVVVVRPKEA